MLRYCKRRKLLAHDSDEAEADQADAQSEETRGHAELVGSAVSGSSPPAGPSFPVRSPGLVAHPGAGAGARNTDFDRPLCVGRDGFTLHAATRAGGADLVGREALLKYILRPAVAQEHRSKKRGGRGDSVFRCAFLDENRSTARLPHGVFLVDGINLSHAWDGFTFGGIMCW
jgi:hypothetical protein